MKLRTPAPIWSPATMTRSRPAFEPWMRTMPGWSSRPLDRSRGAACSARPMGLDSVSPLCSRTSRRGSGPRLKVGFFPCGRECLGAGHRGRTRHLVDWSCALLRCFALDSSWRRSPSRQDFAPLCRSERQRRGRGRAPPRRPRPLPFEPRRCGAPAASTPCSSASVRLTTPTRRETSPPPSRASGRGRGRQPPTC